MTVHDKKELRERTHLEIAVSAAMAAGLAHDPVEARHHIEEIIEKHGERLKASWLRERGGGIKGWLYFLRTFGFEEHLEIRRKATSSDGFEDRTGDELHGGSSVNGGATEQLIPLRLSWVYFRLLWAVVSKTPNTIPRRIAVQAPE